MKTDTRVSRILPDEFEILEEVSLKQYTQVNLDIRRFVTLNLSKEKLFAMTKSELWRLFQVRDEYNSQVKFELAEALKEYYVANMVPPGYKL